MALLRLAFPVVIPSAGSALAPVADGEISKQHVEARQRDAD